MINSLIKHIASLLMLIFLLVNTLQSQEKGDIHYKITSDNTSCSFYGSFKINGNPKCLLDIQYQYNHIAALCPQAKEVILAGKGDNWTKLKFVYEQEPIYRSETIWNRSVDINNNKVEFKLLSSVNSNSLMPTLISSDGYYQITQKEGYVLAEYFLQCQLADDYGTGFYLYIFKKRATNFIYLLYDYSMEHCQ